jgi:hypothetical protein
MTSTTGLQRCSEALHVLPTAEPRVDRGVVLRVEPGIRAVVGREERQEVNASEEPLERPLENRPKARQRATEPVDVGDELDLVAHGDQEVGRAGRRTHCSPSGTVEATRYPSIPPRRRAAVSGMATSIPCRSVTMHSMVIPVRNSKARQPV